MMPPCPTPRNTLWGACPSDQGTVWGACQQPVGTWVEQCINDFVDDFDPANWAFVLEGPQCVGGSGVFTGNTSVLIEGTDADDKPAVPCFDQQTDANMRITIPRDGTLSFSWAYTTFDVSGSLYDPFGIKVNGMFMVLTSNCDDPITATCPTMESGSFSIAVMQGDVFDFTQRSIDNIGGHAQTDITGFQFCWVAA